jgi:hypothetical protein
VDIKKFKRAMYEARDTHTDHVSIPMDQLFALIDLAQAALTMNSVLQGPEMESAEYTLRTAAGNWLSR